MKLIFDCRFIRFDHHDGISRFSSALFGAVSKRVQAIALISDLRQLRFLPEGVEYIIGNDPLDAWSELRLPSKLNALGATHVFSPMQTMGSFGRRYKLILTLHDLIYYSHPKAPPSLPLLVRIAWRAYHLNFWAARFLLNRADAVVTVSETSKQLILQNKLTVKPVHVIYNAPAMSSLNSFSTAAKTARGRNQLLYMGSFMQYKNVECLIQAMKDLPDHELVLLSKIHPSRQAELLALAGDNKDRIIFRNGVDDDQYQKLLEGAFALVSASKDEGFGIPLVEAMSHGIPLVVSDLPIFREVAGDAGYFFDPTDPRGFASSINKLAEQSVWEAASRKSLERAAFFNWDDSAEVLLQALKKC
jgi:glycosyltransferase involved in cell wall biosynthesis